MANVTLRLVKGSPLTNAEVDNNFSNLNIFKTEIGGDLGGNVLYPTVIGLQGRSVSNAAPSNTQVLTWSDTSNSWIPGDAAATYDDLPEKPAVNVIISGAVTGNANVTLSNINTNIIGITTSYDYTNLDSRFLKLQETSLQYVEGDVNFQGNVSFTGNITTISANNLIVEDNLIQLAKNNTSDTLDIGFIGHYFVGSNAHAGFFRDASDNGLWKIFDGYPIEPTLNVNIDTSNALFRLANFAANIVFVNRINVTDSNTVVNLNADLLDGQQGSYYVDYTNTTNPPAANIELTGDVTGVANVSLSAGTNQITISTSIQPNSVALGTDTTGNYTNRVEPGAGISATGTADEGNVITVGLSTTGVVANTYGNATIIPVITIDSYGRITSASNVNLSASAGTTNYASLENKPAANIVIAGYVSGTSNVVLQANTNIITVSTVRSNVEFYFANTAPSTPATGDRWTHSETGLSYVYINDGNSSQWVDVTSYSSITSSGSSQTTTDSLSPFLLMGA